MGLRPDSPARELRQKEPRGGINAHIEDNVETSPAGGGALSQYCHHLEFHQSLMSSFSLLFSTCSSLVSSMYRTWWKLQPCDWLVALAVVTSKVFSCLGPNGCYLQRGWWTNSFLPPTIKSTYLLEIECGTGLVSLSLSWVDLPTNHRLPTIKDEPLPFAVTNKLLLILQNPYLIGHLLLGALLHTPRNHHSLGSVYTSLFALIT